MSCPSALSSWSNSRLSCRQRYRRQSFSLRRRRSSKLKCKSWPASKLSLNSALNVGRSLRICSRRPDPCRSEEHTSELQSRENLVCRLLLEKKKNYYFDSMLV